MLLMVIGTSAWAKTYTESVYSFTSSSLATGLSTNGTFNTSYYKMTQGQYAEISAATLFGTEKLSTSMRVNVACGTFGSWSGAKTITLVAAFYDSSDNVLTSQEYTTGTLNSTQGTYRGEITLSKPTDPSAIAKLRITFDTFTTGSEARLAGIKLTYQTEGGEAIPTYTLNIVQPAAGGTLSVTDGNTPIENGASVEVGTNLTCKVTNIPEGKRFSRFYVNYDNDGQLYKATNPATFNNIPTENISAATISVTYEDLERYTVAWNVNGIEVKSETVYEGTTVTAPEVEDVNGKIFVGWAESSSVDSETGDLVTPILTATKTVTYHAVYASLVSAGTSETETLTNSEVGDLSSSANLAYTTKKSYSGTNIDYNIYAYTDAKDRKWMQLKKDGGSRVEITAPGKISNVEVTITSASNSSGGINDISKHTAYSGYVGLVTADCSFSSTSKNIGITNTITSNIASIDVNAKDQTESVILKVSTGARVWAISVTYGSPAIYSDYTTTVAPPEPEPTSGTINLVAQGVMPGVNNEGGMMEGLNLYFATFSHGKDVIITGDDLFAVCPVGVDEGYLSTLPCEQSMAAVTDQEVMDEEGCAIGYFVPANTGVLVVSMGNEATYYFPVADPSNMISDFDPEGINMLQPASKDKAELPNHKFYMLAYGDNSKNPASLGFYWGKADGAAFTSREGSAYLAVPTDSNVKGFAFSSIADAIKNVEVKNNNGAIYNLQGQRVEKAQKGLYIVNGKKVVVK